MNLSHQSSHQHRNGAAPTRAPRTCYRRLMHDVLLYIPCPRLLDLQILESWWTADTQRWWVARPSNNHSLHGYTCFVDNWTRFLDRSSHLRLGHSAKQLHHWWYWGGKYRHGMGVFVEVVGHNKHLSCIHAVASVLGVDIWCLYDLHILFLYVLSHCRVWHSTFCEEFDQDSGHVWSLK